MGLGKRCSSRGNERLGAAGCVRFGRKRVMHFNFNYMEEEEVDYCFAVPKMKKHCDENCGFVSHKPVILIDSLPQDILIKILCGVEHDDLKRLLLVSKTFKEAAEIARQFHFAYTTPTKRLPFRNAVDFEKCEEFDDLDHAQNAPKQTRVPKSRFVGNKEEEWWPRRALFMEMETDI